MTFLLFLFGIFLALGMFLLTADLLRLPRLATQRAMLSVGRQEKKQARSVEALLMGWAIKLAPHIHMDEYKRGRLKNTLAAAGLNMTPEEYTAFAMIKTGAVLLTVIPCLLIFPMLALIVVLLAVAVYFKEIRRAEEKLSAKRDEIEAELPRFVATITQELAASRDVLSMIEHYKQNSGPVFSAELDVLTADMRSGSYEAALTRFEARFNSPLLSDIVRGLIGVLRGDNGVHYFQMLSHDMKQLELQRLKAKAMKIPPKIRVFSFVLLMCFLVTYARHLRQGERAEPEGMIVHLNPTEQRTIIEALVEQQERQEQAMSQTEQLLRRMTGSITAYMDEVGRYPLHISDYDKTVLAIRDGEFDAFKNLYPRVSDQTDDLLIEVAGRPGVVGGNMTLILLAAVERFSPEAYLTACKRAVETGDSWRVQTLVKESEGRLSEPLPSLHGEVILYAYTNNCRNIAKDLIAQCTPEQIASVPPKLLRWVAEKLDFQTAVDLVDKGVRPGDEVAGILRTLTGQHQEWMAERLLEHGMPVEPDNYDALYACVSNQAVGAAKLLLDRGIDLEQYQLWAEHRPKGDGYTETMEELAAYWSELQNSTQPEDSPMKGMNL